MEISNFKVLCEAESGIKKQYMKLSCDGKELNGNSTLKNLGVRNGDMIVLIKIKPPSSTVSSAPNHGAPIIDFGSITLPSTNSTPTAVPLQASNHAQQLLNKLRSSPADVALLRERNLPLAEAVQANDIELFTRILKSQDQEAEVREQNQLRMLSGNPFDPNIQNQIEEAIRLKNVERNMETAIEFSPESFGSVVMLYINCIVNGHHIKAFVDSGAQMTIMSLACAKRCDLERLIDKRWQGVAKGVGIQKIIGRIHLCQIQIESDFLQSSFSVLEDQPMEMLLGLDMLRRHQCSIDLRTNTLNIGTTGTVTHFLPENELPKSLADEWTDQEKAIMEDTPSTSKSPGNAPVSPVSAYKPVEADVFQLMSNGFSKEMCVAALVNSRGDLDQALMNLLSNQ